MNKINILIVDDHKIVRQGLKALLIGEKEIKIVAEASDFIEVSEILKTITPDIIILDISLPQKCGIEIAEEITNNHPNIKTIMLSANVNEENIIKSIKAGAKGFLPKDTSKEEFVNAVKAVFSGNEYFGDEISQIIYKSYVKIIKSPKEESPNLTEREIEIIKLIGESLSHKQIADKLSISIRTVETHKKNILEKLNLQNSVDIVKYAIKNGIITL